MRRILVLLLALAIPAPAAASVRADGSDLSLETVLPRLPGKNSVRWWEFDWRYTEFTPIEGGAPVRMYFYDAEENIARLAKPFIANAYSEYVERFAYRPSRPIPFLLYNSHFEFESTTAFFISEQVLGVTSTEDLSMALPYWGERSRFEHVMRHELAHQFTLQKVDDAGRDAGCNPIQGMPLWFIEGAAELFSQPELTAEVRAVLADRFLDVKARGRERALPGFFDEGPGSFERVYLIGHAQMRFLEAEFGEGTVRRILTQSPRMCTALAPLFGAVPAISPFSALVTDVTGVPEDVLDQRWRKWAEATVAPALSSPQPLATLDVIDDLGLGDIDSFTLSPDGRVVFFRTLDRDTGIARLYLRDLADPTSLKKVTEDQQLGLVSLHPLDRRVTAIGPDRLAYIGRKGATDRVFVHRWRRVESDGKVRFEVRGKVEHNLEDYATLIEGGSPAFDPRNGQLLFVGLSRGTGFLDVFRIEEPFDDHSPIARITNTSYAEQGLAFAPNGQLYLVSSATPDARYELMRLEGGQQVPLTGFGGPHEVRNPSPAGDDRVLFQSDASGFLQAYVLKGDTVTRLTDVPTSFTQPAIDGEGNLLGLSLIDNRARLVRMKPDQWLSIPGNAEVSPSLAPWAVPQAPLGEVHDYEPLENIQLAAARGLISLGPLIFGDLAFTDLFKSQLAGISVRVLGDIEGSEGTLFYFDRSGRVILGGTLFMETDLQLQPGVRSLDNSYLLQRIGASLQLEYPFGRYARVGAFLSPQALRAFRFRGGSVAFAEERAGTYAALQAGVRYGQDTTRNSVIGPVGGSSLTLQVDGTGVLGGAKPFASARGDYQVWQALVPGSERIFLHGRLGAGTSFGEEFRDQFYLPAAYNLRTFPEGALDLIGDGYYLASLELQFPLAPPIGELIFLQGLVGVDAGSIFFENAGAASDRVAAAVVGLNVGLGPLALRFHFSRPFSIGPNLRYDRWLSYISLSTPFFFE